MANMSYCRFTNTLADLSDCYDHMDDKPDNDEPANWEEIRAKERLIKLCQRIADDYGEDT